MQVLCRASALRGQVHYGKEEGRAVFGPHECADHCGGVGAVERKGEGDAVAVWGEGLHRAVRVIKEGDAAATEAVSA